MLDFLTASPSELDALDRKDTRSGFGQGLLEVGQIHDNVVALCADLTGSLKMNAFRDRLLSRSIIESTTIVALKQSQITLNKWRLHFRCPVGYILGSPRVLPTLSGPGAFPQVEVPIQIGSNRLLVLKACPGIGHKLRRH